MNGMEYISVCERDGSGNPFSAWVDMPLRSASPAFVTLRQTSFLPPSQSLDATQSGIAKLKKIAADSPTPRMALSVAAGIRPQIPPTFLVSPPKFFRV